MSIAENFSSSKNRVLDQIDTKQSINKITFKKKKSLWFSDYHYYLFHSLKPELRFCIWHVRDSQWWESLTMVPAGNKALTPFIDQPYHKNNSMYVPLILRFKKNRLQSLLEASFTNTKFSLIKRTVGPLEKYEIIEYGCVHNWF